MPHLSQTDFLLILILTVCWFNFWELRAIRKRFTRDD